nr:zinc knuckle CX2CX4HX4C [Tanacetum cinerariifolium]
MEKVDPSVVTKYLANDFNELIEKLSSQSSIHANAEANANIEMGGPAITNSSDNSRGIGDKGSFASLLKKPMTSKAVRLYEECRICYREKAPFSSCGELCEECMGKFGLERAMLSNGFFFFQFSSRDRMKRVLENGPLLIRLVPIILNIWTLNTKLKKETITSTPIWVKLHNVPIVAYSKIELSLITSQIGNPIMLDAYTSMMCQKSWGKNSYVRALVEVSSLNPLQDSLIVAIPFPNGSGHSLESIEVEYELTPPRYETCKIFDHVDDACPKRVKVAVQSQMEDDGFTKVNNIKNKNKKQSTNQ